MKAAIILRNNLYTCGDFGQLQMANIPLNLSCGCTVTLGIYPDLHLASYEDVVVSRLVLLQS